MLLPMHHTHAVQLTTVASAHVLTAFSRTATVQLMLVCSVTRSSLRHRLLPARAHRAAAVVLRTVLLRLVRLDFTRTVVEHALSVRLLLGPRLTRRTAARPLLTAK